MEPRVSPPWRDSQLLTHVRCMEGGGHGEGTRGGAQVGPTSRRMGHAGDVRFLRTAQMPAWRRPAGKCRGRSGLDQKAPHPEWRRVPFPLLQNGYTTPNCQGWDSRPGVRPQSSQTGPADETGGPLKNGPHTEQKPGLGRRLPPSHGQLGCFTGSVRPPAPCSVSRRHCKQQH